jgi:hypothetical protein
MRLHEKLREFCREDEVRAEVRATASLTNVELIAALLYGQPQRMCEPHRVLTLACAIAQIHVRICPKKGEQ